jgi:hypothetical protein
MGRGARGREEGGGWSLRESDSGSWEGEGEGKGWGELGSWGG